MPLSQASKAYREGRPIDGVPFALELLDRIEFADAPDLLAQLTTANRKQILALKDRLYGTHRLEDSPAVRRGTLATLAPFRDCIDDTCRLHASAFSSILRNKLHILLE